MPIPLFALSIASFAIGTAEFVIVGLLPEIAADFGVGIPTAGLLVTAYALGVVVGGPILTVLATRLSRRLTLILLMSLFVVGNVLCAAAPTYGFMMAARVVTAFVHAAFFGIAVVVAADLVAANRRASAMALVFAGLTVAHILGIPGGAAVGHATSWRLTFLAIAAVGVVAVAVIAIFVPAKTGGRSESASLAGEFRVLAKPQVLLVLAHATLPGCSAGIIYAFIKPLLETVTGVPATGVPWYLLALGVGATAGILIGGRLADWKLLPSLLAIFAILIVFYLCLVPATGSAGLMLVMMFVWGLVLFATAAPIQARAVNVAIEAPNLASTLNQSATNLGNAAGPAIGAAALTLGVGYGSLPWLGAAIAFVALCLTALSLGLERRGAGRAASWPAEP